VIEGLKNNMKKLRETTFMKNFKKAIITLF